MNRLLTALAVAAGFSVNLKAADGTWTAGTGGDWSETANWQDGTPAGGTGSTAFFASGTGTVNNDVADLQLFGLQFAGGGFTLAGGTIALDSAGFITVLGGSHTVNAPLVLSGGTALKAALNQSLTLAGEISGTGGLTVNGGRVTLANMANLYTGQTVLQTGLLEVASIGSLGAGSAPLVIGKGTFRFAGTEPGTLEQGYTVISGGGTAVTVLDVRTNLTVSGKVDAPNNIGGRVIKAGPGTLEYAYPGYQMMNRGGSGVTANRTLVFDENNGGAGVEGFQDFTVAEGKLLFNTPGQTNRFVGHMAVGVRYPSAAHMEIRSGVVQNPDSWLSISRGNGDTTTPYSSTVTVTGGRLEVNGLVMGYAAEMPSFRSTPVLTQTGGEIVVAGDAYLPENGGGVATVTLSGGTFTQNGLNQGLDFSRGGTAGSVMTISDSAVVSLAKLRVNTGGTFSVTNGGTLALRSMASTSSGTVLFDNATLTTYAPVNQPSDWFHNTSKLLIGAGGLTVDVPAGQYAYLGTAPTPDPLNPGGTITKTGAGTLSLYNMEMPIAVNAGRLRLMGGHISTNKAAKTIPLAAGAQLELAVPHAAEADTLALTGTTGLALTVPDLAARTEVWQSNSGATRRHDGVLQVLSPAGNTVGSVFMTRPFYVTNAWRVDFSVAAASGRTLGSQGDGVCFVVQNDARGVSAVSTNVTGFGYAGAAFPVTNSFAVALDLTNRRLRFGTNGVFAAEVYDLASLLPGLGADNDKTYFAVSYDGSGTVTCTLTRKGIQTLAYPFSVDLQALLRNPRGFIGFTAGNTSGRLEQHLVGDIALSTLSVTPKTYGQYGGNVSLAAGQTLGVALNPVRTQNGFGLGQFTYGDGSVLEVTQPRAPFTPVPTVEDQSLWQLNGKSFWTPDGRLAISSNAANSSGAAYLKTPYRVADSWAASFVYDIGVTSAPPADGFSFTLQNKDVTAANTVFTGGLTPAFSIAWRYYDGTIRTTSIRMTTNDVHNITTYDMDPVDLVKHGPARITIAYDAPGKTVTVTTVQAGGRTNVTAYTGVDIGAVLKSQTAYVGFTAYTGGLFAQNLISDFSFAEQGGADTSWQRGYLAFGNATGSGTLVKRGNGALGIQDGPGNPFTNATVRLDEGGLVLRKAACEPVTLGNDFYLSPWASWAPGGALQTMRTVGSTSGNGVTAKRHAVTQAWTARFTFFVGARNGAADAFTFFMHNDPRGPSALGTAFSGGGYQSIANSVALRWNFYEGNSMSNTVEYGQAGNWVTSTRRSNLPIKITTIQEETDMEVRHDPAAKTLSLRMWQGSNTFTTVFTDVDIAAQIGDSLAHIGFGGGNGGAQCETRVKDFSFTLDAPSDPLPVTACLGAAVFPAGTTNMVTLDTVVPGASFAVASAQVGAGASVGVESANGNGGTLTLTAATLTGDAAFDVRPGTTLALEFTGKQYVEELYVDGAQMTGGRYTSATAGWISGAGQLIVRNPPTGTVIFLR